MGERNWRNSILQADAMLGPDEVPALLADLHKIGLGLSLPRVERERLSQSPPHGSASAL